MNPIDQLKAVLCDPTGKCCIDGSDEDRAIIDRALQALAQPKQAVVSFPSFMRRRIEQAMEDAINPQGMSVHDGKVKVLVSDLHRMLLVIDSAPQRKEWVGLTEDQIQLMAHNDDKGDWSDLRFRSCWHNGYVDGVNAANAKLKEKNT